MYNVSGGTQDMSVESSGLQRSRTESHLLEWQARAASPPYSARPQLVQYGQSAPSFLYQGGQTENTQQALAFYAPPLHQETLMEVRVCKEMATVYILFHSIIKWLVKYS